MKSFESSATRLGSTEGHALALSACAEFGPAWVRQFVRRLLAVSVLPVVMAFTVATNRVVAHTHVEIIYREKRLELIYYDYDYGESDPAHVQIPVDAVAARALSEDSAFLPWLGEGGATVWLLPQTEDPRLIWLGVGSAGVPADPFAGPLTLRLQSVEGPGHFALFFTDSFGQPMRQMSSRDGIGSDDVMSVPARSHIHCNWAFTAPGTYRIGLVAAGILRADNISVESKPTFFTFEVLLPAAPELRLEADSGPNLELRLDGHPGVDYGVQTSPDLLHWTFWAYTRSGQSVSMVLTNDATSTHLFLRVHLRLDGATTPPTP